MTLPALTIAKLYRCRWQVELFFKWIKQHLRIKAFYGTSENAVKTQIWIAISVYALVAIIRKQHKLDLSLYGRRFARKSNISKFAIWEMYKYQIILNYFRYQMDICNLSHLWFCCQTEGPDNLTLRQKKRANP